MAYNGSKPEIIAAGHLCIDLLPHMDHVSLGALSRPGLLSEVDSMQISTGGSVSNTGLALHRLGIDVRLVSQVGNDAIGKLITDFLRFRDPALIQSIQTIEHIASSYTIVLSPERVDRIFLHCPGTNAHFKPSDISPNSVLGAKIFHLGYPPLLPQFYIDNGIGLAELFDSLQQLGIITSLDMALPDPNSASGKADWQLFLQNVLPFVDVFVPSFEEIVYMLRRADFERHDTYAQGTSGLLSMKYVKNITNELISMGVSIAGIKCGENGIVLHTASEEKISHVCSALQLSSDWENHFLHQPAFDVTLVGTTGAGDSAYAGLLSAMVRGMSMRDAIRWASAVGACNVEAADATSGIQTWTETQQRLDKGWKTRPSRLNN